MKYKNFKIENYRAIVKPINIDVTKGLIPLVGVNECGKTTILQGIFCFDEHNDRLNEGRHLKNIMNLYETEDKGSCKISALIACQPEAISGALEYLRRTNVQEIEKLENMLESNTADLEDAAINKIQERYGTLLNEKEKLGLFIENLQEDDVDLVISRELTETQTNKVEGKYSTDFFDNEDWITEQNMHLFCRELLNQAPFILYSDDFNDRAYGELIIGSENNEDWQDIYRRVFASQGEDKKEVYELDAVFDMNPNRQSSILNHTSAFLSRILTKSWGELTLSDETIHVKLTMEKRIKKVSDKAGTEFDVEEKVLKIKIEESNETGLGLQFDLTDRSKGFLWYYNFIMKIQFNPKQAGDQGTTIFLLDEPGSYLHETAQKQLCKDLKHTAETEGSIIYCTHFSQLLSPEIIPVNNIQIVTKNKSVIAATHLAECNTKGQRNAALQPVYEALGMPMYTIDFTENIVCVEGIYDKYAIELFCSLAENIVVFPSVSAETIVHNISYFITYKKQYLAIWDDDKAGKKAKKKAEKIFGYHESNNFCLLPNENVKAVMRMEDMFSEADFLMMSEKLKIKNNGIYDKQNYQNIINALRFEVGDALLQDIIDNLSPYARQQFAQLTSKIKQHFRVNNSAKNKQKMVKKDSTNNSASPAGVASFKLNS